MGIETREPAGLPRWDLSKRLAADPQFGEKCDAIYRDLATSKKVVGIGECGFDYYRLSERLAEDNTGGNGLCRTERMKGMSVIMVKILFPESGAVGTTACRVFTGFRRWRPAP